MTTAIETPVYRLRDSRTLDFYEDERIKPTDDVRGRYAELREPLRADAIEEAARRVVGSIDAGEPYERTEMVLADLREALGRVDAERRRDARVRLARSLRDQLEAREPGVISLYDYDWPEMIETVDEELVFACAEEIFDALGDALRLASAAGVAVAAIVAPYEAEWGEKLAGVG